MKENNLKFFTAFAVIIVSLFTMLVLTSNKNKVSTEIESNNEYNIYLFYKETCGYCHSLMNFLDSLPDEMQDKYNLVKYDISTNSEYSSLMYEVGDYFDDAVSGVPYFVVGTETFRGYSTNYDSDIIDAINELENNYYDVLEEMNR